MVKFNKLLSIIESALFPINAKKYIAGLTLYATFIAAIDQLLMKEAIKDADGETTFTIDANNTNATVREISHAVLWNCREFSVTREYYITLYEFGIAVLGLYVFIYMTECKCNCEAPDVLKYIFELVYRVAFVFMLLSYDSDPLACMSGPSRITYNEDEQTVELTFYQSVLTFQTAAAYISVILSALAFILNIFATILDCWKSTKKDSNNLELYELTIDKKSVEKLEKSGISVDKRKTLKNLNPEHYIIVHVCT